MLLTPSIFLSARRTAAFLESEGVGILTRAQVHSVQKGGEGILATVQIDGEERQVRAERLLVAAGRRPNTDRIAIERAGVELDEEAPCAWTSTCARTSRMCSPQAT